MPPRFFDARSNPGRGLTLIEVVVASGLFLVVSTVILFTLRAGLNNRARFDQQEEALRACLLSVEHLRGELASAWLENVANDRLVYRTPTLDEQGNVKVGPNGDIVWSEQRVLSVKNDSLVRQQGDQARVLARLGPGGRLDVEPFSPTLVQVTVKATHGSGYQLTRSYRLLNQN